MASLNQVELIGYLGSDPQERKTRDGSLKVCLLSVATREAWQKDGERQERTEWHKVVLFGRQAEFALKWLKKGNLVYVMGSLRTREWEDDGVKRYITEIMGRRAQSLERKGSSLEKPRGERQKGGEEYYDEVPF